MRLKTMLMLGAMAAILAGCNDTLETVSGPDVSRVSNKVAYQLSGHVAEKMRSMGMERNSPIMLRIFKEEGTLEVLKAKTNNRFDVIATYKICAWSGKLGPKTKEGDRQAPEGFYPLRPQQLNPNSSYYLAINTGYPNRFDQANGRGGSNLMIHGACSSSGCYSMTDAQMLEIFAFARDAFKGGQESVQLQAFPFRMTAENMVRHRDNPNYEFWKNLKTGYDQFEVTKRPPEVNICEKKYVFNQQTDGKFTPGGQCPVMTTPGALQGAMASYNKAYDRDYDKASKKLKGMVWYEPSEGERKAIVAEQRKGKELAYAPTGSSLDAGKLMTVEQMQKKQAEREAALAAAQQRKLEAEENAKLAKAIGAAKIPVPSKNPNEGMVQQATVTEEKTPKRSWKFWEKDPEPVVEEVPVAAVDPATAVDGKATDKAAADKTAKAVNPAKVGDQSKPAETARTGTEPAADGTDAVEQQAAIVEPQPKKKPFWKLWGN
ncbi:murein L,D-transpeptidase family protein [Pararhizobium sp.]|uniref:murein L,D-transpeptidase family protein n=1 Tax=Pararhizobium sp. TaxID=1977563 RepID=UPI00272237E0|nr:murein L,D-transpeptidase family protein [Pararhizobium sp.]MDO9417474.1 murein L,D-transpeptidase family protein [Pararhizobium sp.]